MDANFRRGRGRLIFGAELLREDIAGRTGHCCLHHSELAVSAADGNAFIELLDVHLGYLGVGRVESFLWKTFAQPELSAVEFEE